METANRYDFLCDTESSDLQAILKKKAKKAKKAAKKLVGKENSENDGKVDYKSDDKVNDEKKTKFVVPGRGMHFQQEQQQEPPKSRSMKDTQNIQDNGNFENGFSETKRHFDRERYNGNNRNYENREQRQNRRNKEENGTESFDNFGGNRTFQNNGFASTNRGNRYNTNGNRNNENTNAHDIEYNSQFNNQRERNDDRPPRRQGNDRNFGNRRFDGQRRNFDGRGGKREFDRQSGSDKTGVKAVEKREGGGAHNWGTHKQDIEDLNLNTETEDKDEGNSEEKIKSQENLAVEDVKLTLDEYKEIIGQRAKPVYNTRKAGEGEDKKKWKNMVRLDKPKKKEDNSEDEYEFDPTQYPQRKGKIRVVDTIEVRFNDVKRRANARRNRQNLDNRRNDETNRQNAPQIDDRNFPSLG